MKLFRHPVGQWWCWGVAGWLGAAMGCHAGNYTNFQVAIYIPVGVVNSFENPQKLEEDWARISRQLKVDKVYVEVQRDHQLADDQLLERVKQFFQNHGVETAGGMALSDGSTGGQFNSFCYTDPADRAFIKAAAERAARHFNEIIQDDFFFVNTKTASDIAAKGYQSWTEFRLKLMDDAAENLIIRPARAVNPGVKLVIKFPNWYEHFQGLGYDLDREPKLFDGIHTGTETRDSVITDQHLQPYESYQIIRYFDNIAPGRNGGGWVDTYSIRYVDRYAEQLWDTVFAKAREMTLFEWSAMSQPIQAGDRSAWEHLPTSLNYQDMIKTDAQPTMARVAGYALEQADRVLGQLGQPMGLASYKPYQSTGEDFLHNYLGMIGIPIDLHPDYPTNAATILLTEAAKFDPLIVTKIKHSLEAGKSVVITSGLLQALQDKGLGEIVEARCNGRRVLAHHYAAGYGAGNFSTLDDRGNADILFPEIDFLTNEAWALVRAEANGNGFPLLLMDRYASGVLYILDVPDNLNDLYSLPPEVAGAIKRYVLQDFPIRLDGPSQIALFAYDNHTFIVESFLPTEAAVTVSAGKNFTHVRNLVTGQVVAGNVPEANSRWQQGGAYATNAKFQLHLEPHSYAAYELEP